MIVISFDLLGVSEDIKSPRYITFTYISKLMMIFNI
jgi:hypothetical protein